MPSSGTTEDKVILCPTSPDDWKEIEHGFQKYWKVQHATGALESTSHCDVPDEISAPTLVVRASTQSSPWPWRMLTINSSGMTMLPLGHSQMVISSSTVI